MTEPEHFRKASRRALALRVRFRRADGLGALEEATSTSDFSVGGAFLQADRVLPRETRLELTLTSPTAWDPLVIAAEVRWTSDGDGTQPRGMGVEFRDLTREQSAALYELVHASVFAGGDPSP
jgi:hypothetical protein